MLGYKELYPMLGPLFEKIMHKILKTPVYSHATDKMALILTAGDENQTRHATIGYTRVRS